MTMPDTLQRIFEYAHQIQECRRVLKSGKGRLIDVVGELDAMTEIHRLRGEVL
jgi:hypothetical protein